MVNAAVSKTARCVQTTGCGFESYHLWIERQFNGRTLFLNLEINFYSSLFLLREPVMWVRILPFRLRALQEKGVGTSYIKINLSLIINTNSNQISDGQFGLMDSFSSASHMCGWQRGRLHRPAKAEVPYGIRRFESFTAR